MGMLPVRKPQRFTLFVGLFRGPESFAAVPYSVSEFLLSESEPEPRGFF